MCLELWIDLSFMCVFVFNDQDWGSNVARKTRGCAVHRAQSETFTSLPG
jgi:hypothetical protein